MLNEKAYAFLVQGLAKIDVGHLFFLYTFGIVNVYKTLEKTHAINEGKSCKNRELKVKIVPFS